MIVLPEVSLVTINPDLLMGLLTCLFIFRIAFLAEVQSECELIGAAAR